MNLYAYVGGNPVNLVDPEGLTDRPWPVNGKVKVHKKCQQAICSIDMDHRKIYSTNPGGSTPGSADVDFVEVNGKWYKIGMWNFDIDDSCKADDGFREATPEELNDIKSILGDR